MKLTTRVGIIGQGAIGSLFAYYWRDLNPLILVRKKTDTKICLELPDKTLFHADFDQELISQNKSNLDILVIPIKCYQIDQCIEDIRPWINTNTLILLVQNGMGGAEKLQAAFADNTIYAGTTTDAVFKKQNNHFNVAAFGKLEIGRFTTTLPQHTDNLHEYDCLLETFVSHHPCASMHGDVSKILFKKLAVNAAINPLTALLNTKNGELIHRNKELVQIINEINQVYQALSLPITIQEIESAIYAVIENTKDNFSSMHQDFKYKRKTEIDGVLGYLLEQATAFGLDTPFIKNMYTQIKQIELDF